MTQIPMECPKCKRYGSVPSTKINTPLNCKKCSAEFYLNPQGIAVLGMPPGYRTAPVEEKKKAKKDVDFEFDPGALWRDLDPAQRNRFLGIAAAVILVVGGAAMYANMPTTDRLTQAALDVTRAVADDNASRLASLAADGTSEDATQWLEKVRSRYGIRGRSGDFKMSASLMGGGGASDKAQILATLGALSPDALAPPKAEKKAAEANSFRDVGQEDEGMVPLNLHFVMDRRGNWRLDGTATLQQLASERKRGRAGAG